MPVRHSVDAHDPITALLQPPADETPEQRTARLVAEAEAKRVNDEIDARLKLDRAEWKRRKKAVKLLLLGQAESGKSTTLKNFQMLYSSETWNKTRANWRAVIQLNLIRHVLMILDLVNSHLVIPSSSASSPSSLYPATHALPLVSTSNPRAPEIMTSLPLPALTDKHRTLKLRLAPLRHVEADLRARLGVEADTPVGFHSPLSSPQTPDSSLNEATVRSWNGALNGYERHESGEQRLRNRSSVLKGGDEAMEVLDACREDIISLWNDDVVQDILARRRIKLEDEPGFFLNDVNRIADRQYTPSDEDVIRARLRTNGVQEHVLTPEGAGSSSKEDWIIYDVGGSRTQRYAWVPFFENVSAIIFLAPLSCFNEQLAEDPAVNRLEDTHMIWKAICGSSLLAESTLIVFMNKIDLLDRKLRQGISFAKTVSAYGSQPNNVTSVVKFMRNSFRDVHQRNSPVPRNFYGYATSVIDIKGTQKTLTSIRDGIVLHNFKGADLIN